MVSVALVQPTIRRYNGANEQIVTALSILPLVPLSFVVASRFCFLMG